MCGRVGARRGAAKSRRRREWSGGDGREEAEPRLCRIGEWPGWKRRANAGTGERGVARVKALVGGAELWCGARCTKSRLDKASQDCVGRARHLG